MNTKSLHRSKAKRQLSGLKKLESLICIMIITLRTFLTQQKTLTNLRIQSTLDIPKVHEQLGQKRICRIILLEKDREGIQEYKVRSCQWKSILLTTGIKILPTRNRYRIDHLIIHTNSNLQRGQLIMMLSTCSLRKAFSRCSKHKRISMLVHYSKSIIIRDKKVIILINNPARIIHIKISMVASR